MKMNEMIDHTLLKPAATQEQIEKLCQQAAAYRFASVCVNSCWVGLCARLLKGTGVRVCTVIGFPLGAMSTAAKAAEARQAMQDGADEFDMVINIGRLKMGDIEYVTSDIAAVVQSVAGHVVKVIIETCLLTDPEKVAACQCAVKAGARFVKTSTGFSTGGADVRDVALMKKTVGEAAQVKASGGIHDYQTALAMVEAGASRIGTSAGIAIIESAPKQD